MLDFLPVLGYGSHSAGNSHSRSRADDWSSLRGSSLTVRVKWRWAAPVQGIVAPWSLYVRGALVFELSGA